LSASENEKGAISTFGGIASCCASPQDGYCGGPSASAVCAGDLGGARGSDKDGGPVLRAWDQGRASYNWKAKCVVSRGLLGESGAVWAAGRRTIAGLTAGFGPLSLGGPVNDPLVAEVCPRCHRRVFLQRSGVAVKGGERRRRACGRRHQNAD
jgi:hypothetical protein